MSIRKLALALILFSTPLLAADDLKPTQWTIDGITREALIYAPSTATTQPCPVIFAFHGHGGSMQNASKWDLQSLWPEAIVVYPQGINTPGRLTDKQGNYPGWQAAPGEQNDRDLKFVDAMLADLKQKYKVDENRIYATGHSNGGTFTYVLWAARGDQFGAFAPSATTLSLTSVVMEKQAEKNFGRSPKPILHIAGENDKLVKFQWQEATIKALIKVNHCDSEGKPWDDEKNCTLYPSTENSPVIAFIHPGGHVYSPAARQAAVKFFKEHPRAAAAANSSPSPGTPGEGRGEGQPSQPKNDN